MTTTATRPRTSPPVAREDTGPYRAGFSSGHDGAAMGALGGTAWPSEGGEGAPPALAEALTRVEAAIAALDEVELAGEADEAVGAASVTLHRQANRLQARVVELLGEVDARQAYERDGAVSVKQWFRARARCEPGEAGALVAASRRLRRLPRQQPLK